MLVQLENSSFQRASSQLEQGSGTIESTGSADLTDSVESISGIHYYGSYLIRYKIHWPCESFIHSVELCGSAACGRIMIFCILDNLAHNCIFYTIQFFGCL